MRALCRRRSRARFAKDCMRTEIEIEIEVEDDGMCVILCLVVGKSG